METTGSFGYWIRRQRKALDLTQQALAERVGCSLAAIKKIEGDERHPSRQIAERLADILGVPAGQREMFLAVARGLRPVDQLSLARQPGLPAQRNIHFGSHMDKAAASGESSLPNDCTKRIHVAR